MLIKEYRIPMPMTVDEYRIAQLYMIAKKSREETNAAGSGVEIIKNEPYTNGPGGDGQYTFKIFHIERHLPGWFKAILPSDAMKVEEEAWNAYPYTKTRYRCPFIDRFSLEIETVYLADFGSEENAFRLTRKDLDQRTVEHLDIVQSQPVPEVPEENPLIFHSEKTGRGPLTTDWLEQSKKSAGKMPIMCAYKLCRVEVRYWGMQSKCERFIHEIALRKTILRAHRQAWCWQDEYQGLTLADIRRLEDETQQELNRRMALFRNEDHLSSFNLNQSLSPINTTDHRLNALPVPPLTKDDENDNEEFFDAQSYLEGIHPIMSPIRSNSDNPKCSIEILLLIFYGGNIFSTEDVFLSAKKTDFLSFRSTFEHVLRAHYSRQDGKIAIRFVECPSICTDVIRQLHLLSPYASLTTTSDVTHSETLPINAIPLFATSNPNYQTILNQSVTEANRVYQEFVTSNEGMNFSGQVVLIGDANGAILAYDALCVNQNLDDSVSVYTDDGSTTPSLRKRGLNGHQDSVKRVLSNEPVNSAELTTDDGLGLAFSVNEFFSFGSPLSLVLAYRRLLTDTVVRPCCGQLYNLFHACDPNAARIEPLIESQFSQIPACCVPRYSHYPLGDGQSTLLVEYIHRCSTLSASIKAESDLRQMWWGSRRIDYIVYSPESLMNQPTHVLPIVFHSSYWESRDVMAFILRNITRHQEQFPFFNQSVNEERRRFAPLKATERWLHRSTGVKIRNLAPNHRANDTMVLDARPQSIQGKFCYGPIDMVNLANELVDIYVMRSAPYGEWAFFDTVETDGHGRVRYTVSEPKKLPIGLHPVKLVVRGDQTSVDLYLTVLPPKCEAVIFSIDGSFTSSFSVRHHNPKVRPGAVDVVRYWQELGYIIIYVTARPDLQQHKVVHWLAQHNFPHGMTLFNNGLSRDPLRHKADMIRTVVTNADLIISAGYGSSRDVAIYQSISVPPDRIFVVGKVKSRFQNHAQFISDGYALHLAGLSKPGLVRASKSDSRHLIHRACFNLPQLASMASATTQSTHSLINTHPQPSSPSGYSTKSMPLTAQHASIDSILSPPMSPVRKDETSDHPIPAPPPLLQQQHNRSRSQLIFTRSHSKSAPSRGISPRINRNSAIISTNQIYNPSSIERV